MINDSLYPVTTTTTKTNYNSFFGFRAGKRVKALGLSGKQINIVDIPPFGPHENKPVFLFFRLTANVASGKMSQQGYEKYMLSHG